MGGAGGGQGERLRLEGSGGECRLTRAPRILSGSAMTHHFPSSPNPLHAPPCLLGGRLGHSSPWPTLFSFSYWNFLLEFPSQARPCNEGRWAGGHLWPSDPQGSRLIAVRQPPPPRQAAAWGVSPGGGGTQSRSPAGRARPQGMSGRHQHPWESPAVCGGLHVSSQPRGTGSASGVRSPRGPRSSCLVQMLDLRVGSPDPWPSASPSPGGLLPPLPAALHSRLVAQHPSSHRPLPVPEHCDQDAVCIRNSNSHLGQVGGQGLGRTGWGQACSGDHIRSGHSGPGFPELGGSGLMQRKWQVGGAQASRSWY